MTYEEYIVRGGTLTQSAYDRIGIGVMRELDRYTSGRISALSPLPEPVRQLIAELCNMTSAYSTDTDADCYRARYDLICNYLSGIKTEDGTPLLYRGVDV